MPLSLPPKAKCTRAQIDEREAAILAAGFALDHDAAYAAGYVRGATRVYLKKIGRVSLAVHPDTATPVIEAAAKSAGGRVGGLIHNSSMSGFPSRRHTGAKEENFGRTVDFRTPGALTAFLRALP
jgi:hypothetical protein